MFLNERIEFDKMEILTLAKMVSKIGLNIVFCIQMQKRIINEGLKKTWYNKYHDILHYTSDFILIKN